MLLPVSLAMAEGHGDRNRPIEVTFTKWVTTFPLMEGFWGDDLANRFVGEIFQRQVSQRQADNCYLPAPNCGRIIRLEALYEFHAGDHSFTALIRGGTSGDSGAAAAGRHHLVRVARRSPGARGISDDTRHDRLCGRTAGRDVLPGNDPRRARPAGLNVPQARRRMDSAEGRSGPDCGSAAGSWMFDCLILGQLCGDEQVFLDLSRLSAGAHTSEARMSTRSMRSYVTQWKVRTSNRQLSWYRPRNRAYAR